MAFNKPVFIGIDLAWSVRNCSGGAVIRDGRLVEARGDLISLEEIVEFVGGHLSPTAGAVVAVDAPLRVPNLNGIRPCERELNADWSRFQAGAHPANRALLARDGSVRGEALVDMLVSHHRFAESTAIPRRSPDRLICEIYPHPAHVSLFGLERTLKYKRNRVIERRLELIRYRQYLRDLRKAKPPLKKTKDLLVRTKIDTLRGQQLKAYEDMLDALTCAYIAYYLWWHGPQRARTYGTLADGHIIVPMTPQMAQRMNEHLPQR
jgi:predicted RNase H-like nuclease